MILLRAVQESDIGGLEHLSALAAERHPGFLNVPADTEGWRERIRFSHKSFAGDFEDGQAAKFIFVAEDLNTRSIVGVSMVSSQHGTKDSPHFYFQVDSEQKFSETINTGFIHGTLKLKIDTDGPTEIGGLLVDPTVRNTEERVGRQISFVRFLYIGLHQNLFKRRVLAELLPPLTKKGKSPLWEAVGRRFTNMDYWEADYLSSKNKEFILSLFPSGKIYVTFLPAEARNAIGKVSKETEPVMHMLKKIGFKYLNQVDPFDGGPHLMANVDDIPPIKKIASLVYAGEKHDLPQEQAAEHQLVLQGLVTARSEQGFRAISTALNFSNDRAYFEKSKATILGLKPGDQIQFMPYY